MNENETITITVEEAKEQIKNMELVFDLLKSEAWKTIIENLYFHDEPIRLVSAIGNLTLTKDQRVNVRHMMYGIPMLQNFINKVIAVGRQAEMDLKDFEEESGRDEQVQ